MMYLLFPRPCMNIPILSMNKPSVKLKRVSKRNLVYYTLCNIPVPASFRESMFFFYHVFRFLYS